MAETGRDEANITEKKCINELRKKIREGSTKEEIYEIMKVYSFWCDLNDEEKNKIYDKNEKEYDKKSDELMTDIKEKYDLKTLSYNILHKLASGKRDEASETIVEEILKREKILKCGATQMEYTHPTQKH